MSDYNAAYNDGWDAAIAKLSAFLERERGRMVGREFRDVAAQMAIIADIASEMGIERVWGLPIGPWPESQPEHEQKERDGPGG